MGGDDGVDDMMMIVCGDVHEIGFGEYPSKIYSG